MSLHGEKGKFDFHNIVGRSRVMLEIFELIEKLAPTNATVLIEGESGTGKELVAKAIHDASSRRDKPFVAVNCPALAEYLLESELFGHEKGAFTGATATRKGRFELADCGTLFLDEIGELSQKMQAKLLRVLQEMEFERVGGTRTIHVDVRVLAATNKHLETGVQAGWFRQDLFYRLNVMKIRLPPLKDRQEDIPLLIDHFMAKYAPEAGKTIKQISYNAVQALMDYSFPGNIRELANMIRSAVILADDEKITIRHFPEQLLRESVPPGGDNSYGNVKSARLLEALKEAIICDNEGMVKQWHRTLKSTTVETIHAFLVESEGKPFSRLEFANFLGYKSKSARNKYGTAGRYLSVLEQTRICSHNGKKANRSR